MKTCSKCRKRIDHRAARCPHCGEPVPGAPGLFQTAVVLVSSGGADLVFRSVNEVPVNLRNKLLRSTNGENSATILIADRRGRREVAKAIQALPGSAQERLVRSWLGNQPRIARPRRAAKRRAAILAVLALLAVAAVVTAILRHWL
jgi:hypothetical protein